jgi:hypothetical protein
LAELRAHLVKGTIPLPGPILQFLSPADKNKGHRSGKARTRKKREGITTLNEQSRTWKMRHAGPLWIRRASFCARLSEALWSRNSCHSSCSA